MKCYSCGKTLSDYESSLKGKLSGQYLDMCKPCINSAQIEYTGNSKLLVSEEPKEWREERKVINLEKPFWEFMEDEDD